VLLSRPVRRVEVAGDSMLPALQPGDRLLVVRNTRLRRGDVVALRDPSQPRRTVVKRIAALPGDAVTVGGEVLNADGGYVVLGDNLPASSDSRSYGVVSRRLVLGRCVHRYWPEHRSGNPDRVEGP
jgi:nickel-type superoxide dismutase maturation protease